MNVDITEAINAFMGEKSDKLKNQKFSIPAFIFGPAYFAYRKYIVGACITWLISLILTVVFNNSLAASIFTTLVFHAVCGVAFPLLYRGFARTACEKTIAKSANEVAAIEDCKKVGGTSIIYVVGLIIISSVALTLLNGMGVVDIDRSNTDVNENVVEEVVTEDTENLSLEELINKEFVNSKTDKFEKVFEFDKQNVYTEDTADSYIVKYYYDKDGKEMDDGTHDVTVRAFVLDGYDEVESIKEFVTKTLSKVASVRSLSMTTGSTVWYEAECQEEKGNMFILFFHQVGDKVYYMEARIAKEYMRYEQSAYKQNALFIPKSVKMLDSVNVDTVESNKVKKEFKTILSSGKKKNTNTVSNTTSNTVSNTTNTSLTNTLKTNTLEENIVED